MKSWTLIASYLWKDTWSRWLEQPSSVLSRLFVGGLLVTVATVILVAYNLIERNLRARLEHFGVNTMVARDVVSFNDPECLPNLARPDRFAPMQEHGAKVTFRQLYGIGAQSPWQRDMPVMSYPAEALSTLAPLLHTNTPLICLSENFPENALVEITFNRQPGIAVVRRVPPL